MSKPRVYIHRVQGCPCGLYMNDANRELLASFAEVVDNGDGAEPVPPDEMVRHLDGVRGILSLRCHPFERLRQRSDLFSDLYLE